jgi:hypothetical protein
VPTATRPEIASDGSVAATHSPSPDDTSRPTVERAKSAVHTKHVSTEKRPAPPPRLSQSGTGTLVLSTSPWCKVAIDGADRGTTPLRADMQPGWHVVQLTNAEFHVSRRIRVEIHPHETVRKSLDFGE